MEPFFWRRLCSQGGPRCPRSQGPPPKHPPRSPVGSCSGSFLLFYVLFYVCFIMLIKCVSFDSKNMFLQENKKRQGHKQDEKHFLKSPLVRAQANRQTVFFSQKGSDSHKQKRQTVCLQSSNLQYKSWKMR